MEIFGFITRGQIKLTKSNVRVKIGTTMYHKVNVINSIKAFPFRHW